MTRSDDRIINFQVFLEISIVLRLENHPAYKEFINDFLERNRTPGDTCAACAACAELAEVSLPKYTAREILLPCYQNLCGMCVGGEKARLHVIGKKLKTFADVLVDLFQAKNLT